MMTGSSHASSLDMAAFCLALFLPDLVPILGLSGNAPWGMAGVAWVATAFLTAESVYSWCVQPMHST